MLRTKFLDRNPQKPSVTIVGLPTHLSATCSRTSQNGFFGQKTLRQTLRALAGAAFGRLSECLAATVNGRAMPRPRYFRKFYFVKRCATFA